MKLSHSISGAFRTFSYWVANGTLGYPLLEGVDYRSTLSEEPSVLEQVYALFANVLEVDGTGQVINAKHAERRAAQWLRQYMEPTFEVIPPFADWEVALHEPPPRVDPSPTEYNGANDRQPPNKPL
jgi:hypothetical protein